MTTQTKDPDDANISTSDKRRTITLTNPSVSTRTTGKSSRRVDKVTQQRADRSGGGFQSASDANTEHRGDSSYTPAMTTAASYSMCASGIL